MLGVPAAPQGFVAAGVFGFAIGGVLTLLPVAWADYFGRTHYGAIRGIALSAQVLAQAAGPLLSGDAARRHGRLRDVAAVLCRAGRRSAWWRRCWRGGRHCRRRGRPNRSGAGLTRPFI